MLVLTKGPGVFGLALMQGRLDEPGFRAMLASTRLNSIGADQWRIVDFGGAGGVAG